MRTTLAIDDDVLAQVKQLAESRSTSLGKMVSDLLRRALENDCPTTTLNGLTVLDPGPRSALVPSAKVGRLAEEEKPLLEGADHRAGGDPEEAGTGAGDRGGARALESGGNLRYRCIN